MEDQVSCIKKFLYDIQRKWGSCDIYRESPIRYLGYANEVGEAFRAWVPLSIVRLSYVISTGYVLADSLDKSHSVYKRPYINREDHQKDIVIAFADTLAWQGLASVIIPGITINRVCALSTFLLRKSTKLGPASVKLFTTALGLTTIPFIIRPIDTLVEVGMNRWARPRYLSEEALKIHLKD